MFKMRSILTVSLLSAVTTASAVVDLTTTTLRTFVTSSDLSLVAFVVPWCDACHELHDPFEEAAETVQDNNWPFARVDCSTEKELCAEFRVPIYPTIRIFHGSDNGSTIYNGRRRSDAMVSFMQRHDQPIVTRLETAEEAGPFSIKDRVTVIGHFDDSDVASVEAFTALAQSKRDEYLFGYTSDDAFGSAEKVQKPSIVLYKTFDEGRAVQQSKSSFVLEEIQDFVTYAATPAIKQIGGDLNHITSARQPLAVILAHGQEQLEQLIRTLWPVAESTEDDLIWVIVDPERYPEYAARIGAVDGEWPAFGIEDETNKFKYVFPKQGSVRELNQAAIRLAVDAFIKKALPSAADELLIGDLTRGNPGEDQLARLERLSGGNWQAPHDEL